MTTREAAWYIISVMSVCLYVCQTITFESLDVGSSYLHIRYIYIQGIRVKFVYIIWSSSSSQEQIKIENPYSPNVKFRSAITLDL